MALETDYYVKLVRPLRYRLGDVTYERGKIVKVNRETRQYLRTAALSAEFVDVLPEDVDAELQAAEVAAQKLGRGDMTREDMGLLDTAAKPTKPTKVKVRRQPAGRSIAV